MLPAELKPVIEKLESLRAQREFQEGFKQSLPADQVDAVNQIIDYLISQAKEAETELVQLADRAVGVKRDNHGNIITGENNRVYTLQFFTQTGPDPEKTAQDALTRYREILMEQVNRLPLRGIDLRAADPSQQREITLSGVYVELHTDKTRDATPAEIEQLKERERNKVDALSSDHSDRQKPQVPLTAIEAAAANRRLVLRGEPGGGKSTFVNHLAYRLAAAGNDPEKGHLDHLPGWEPSDCPTPVIVILRDFAATLPDPLPSKSKAQALLWGFIGDCLADQNLKKAFGPLENALDKGKGFLIFDGLDEVAEGQRVYVRDAVAALCGRFHRARALVTCRVLSYQKPEGDRPDLRLNENQFPIFTLDELTEEQVDRFIDNWYTELREPSTSTLPGRLKEGVRRPDLWRLARNPLLLTIMALVHTHRSRLPDARAELYKEAIDVLLWRWEEQKNESGGSRLRELLDAAGRAEVDLLGVLAEIAYLVHAQVEDENDPERVGDIGIERLRSKLAALHPKNSLDWANELIAVMKRRAGLLVERDESRFAFPHRTFQEYLAGVHLAGLPDYAAETRNKVLDSDQWRVVALLSAGYLTYVNPDQYRRRALVRALCPDKAPQNQIEWQLVSLAGEAILEIGVQRVTDSEEGRELLTRVQGRLVDLLGGGHLNASERALAGVHLARLGDPREGVGVRDDLPDIAWGAIIPAGPYQIGSKEDSDNQPRQINIDADFQLAHYPVTEAQFQAFIDAADFADPQWWAGMPEEESHKINPPAFPFANHPRENVNWYQATAFCRWLSARLGQDIRLPHEYEWEVAARYAGSGQTDERQYPWSGPFDPTQANTREGEFVGRTTAVGSHPTGRQPHAELDDMSGNVWEWCCNKYKDEAVDQVDDSGDRRVLRGGSWNLNRDFARAASRYDGHPHYRFNYVGFRLCRRPISS